MRNKIFLGAATIAVMVLGLSGLFLHAQGNRLQTLRAASGALTVADTSTEVGSLGSGTSSVDRRDPPDDTRAIITLEVTTLTLPDADDEVDFYLQTTYDGGINWVDSQNVHFDNSDNGATATKVLIIDGSIDGPGTSKAINGTDPAAGNEILEAVPANTIWRINGLSPSLVTDATATARQVHVLIDDGTTAFYQSVSASTQTASLTRAYSIGPHGITTTEVDGVHWIPIQSNLFIPAGYRVQTSTTNIQAGDDWGAFVLEVDEWHDPSVLTDGTIGDNVRSYGRPLGSDVRIKTSVTGATAPTYAYSATVIFQ